MVSQTVLMLGALLLGLFGMTTGLFRIEFDMPIALSGTLGLIVVVFGIVIAAAIQAVGLMTFV